MPLFKKIACISLASYMGLLNAAPGHDAAPMMTVEKKVVEEQPDLQAIEDAKVEALLIDFANAYNKADEPRVAVFWNRKFDDNLSQWKALSRRSVTGEASVQGTDVFNKRGDVKKDDVLTSTIGSMGGIKPSGESLGSYERGVKGGSRILASEYVEVRSDQQHRAGMGEAVDFEFSSGYLSPFIENSVNIIDRKAIMRLIERDNAKKAGSEMIADYQKVETDALVDYADYFAEIVFTPSTTAKFGMSFMVTIKAVASGRVVTMFKSDGTPPDLTPKTKTEKWVATNNGFEKQIEQQAIAKEPTIEEVGHQLALETMAKLTKVWKNF